MSRFKRIFLMLLVLSESLLAGAQNSPGKDSSEISRQIQKALTISDTNLQLGLTILDQNQNAAKDIKNHTLIFEADLDRGMAHFNSLLYPEALKDFKRSLAIAKDIKNLQLMAKAYNAIGRTYIYLGDYSSCLKNLFNGLAVAEKAGNQSILSGINIDIGLAYQDLKDHQNALKYLLRAQKIESDLKSKDGLAVVSHNLGDVYRTLGQYDEAKENYRESMNLNHEIGNFGGEATSTSDLANILFTEKQYDSALYYKKKAVDMLKPADRAYFADYCYAMTTYGRMLVDMNELDLAQNYLKESNQCSLLLDDMVYAEIFYRLRYLYYSKKKNYPKALENLKKLSIVKDSLAVESSNFENQRAAVRYEFQQRAREDSLSYQLKLFQQANKVSAYKIRMYLAITIGTLLLAVAGFFTNRFRLTQKRKRGLEIERMRNEIAGDLHDDVGSALSSIQIISSLALKNCKSDPQLKESVSHISQLSNKVALGIKDIVWTVNPVNDTIEALSLHLQRKAGEMLGYCHTKFQFMKKMDDPDLKISPRVRRDIIMIFKEAINNICKYSNATRVDINLIQDKSKFKLTIKDNGKGFNSEEILRGNGLNNMERRASVLGGKISIVSQKEKGTEIALKLSLNATR